MNVEIRNHTYIYIYIHTKNTCIHRQPPAYYIVHHIPRPLFEILRTLYHVKRSQVHWQLEQPLRLPLGLSAGNLQAYDLGLHYGFTGSGFYPCLISGYSFEPIGAAGFDYVNLMHGVRVFH